MTGSSHDAALARLSVHEGVYTNHPADPGGPTNFGIPIHLQPAAAKLKYKKGDFPVTELQADRILTLPVNQYMSLADVETVAAAVMNYYAA
jgi:lysozyme family protein